MTYRKYVSMKMRLAGIALAASLLVGGCNTEGVQTIADTLEGAQLVIFSMGDSFVSGEGNPDVLADDGGPLWLAANVPGATRCHRSRNNAHYMAVDRVTEAWSLSDEEIYVNFACSGSTVRRGLRLARFGDSTTICGTPATPPLPPVCGGSQIDAAAAFVANPDNGVIRVDVVILNIGINDLGFARIIRACTSPPPIQGNCAQNQELLDMIQDGCEAETDQPEPCNGRNRSIVGLDDIEQVVVAIVARIREMLNPKEIILVGYPDPTRDFNGTFCASWSDGFFVGQDENGNPVPGGMPFGPILIPYGASTQEISAIEAQFAFLRVLHPLNTELESAALSSGIRFVDGVANLTANHGICAESFESVNSEAGWVTVIHDERWFHTFKDSFRYQDDIMGSLHPNLAGHEAISHLIEAELRDVLGLPPA